MATQPTEHDSLTVEASDFAKLKYQRAVEAKRTVFTRAMNLYYDDPVAFAEDCFDWDGGGLKPYQAEELAMLNEHHRVETRGPHGIGKTTGFAIAGLWFANTRDALGVDWKCITTAGGWRQLQHYLWPEIAKWIRRLRWDRLGREPYSRQEHLKMGLNLAWGSMFPVASDDPAMIEGAHGQEIMYFFDEGKAIADATFDAAEGAFSNATVTHDFGATKAFALLKSTPGAPVGRMYAIDRRAPGFEDWHTIHVTLEQAIAAGQVEQDWADRRKRQWGENSAVYKNRVLGEFAEEKSNGVIPLSWVEAANERWLDLEATSRLTDGVCDRFGVDVARQGDDKTALALRCDHVIREIRSYEHKALTFTSGITVGLLEAHIGSKATIDCDGLGAGVYDNVAEDMGDFRVIAFHAGARTDKRDRSGELGFVNVRSAAWWHLRELLDPQYDPQLALPPSDQLTGDLTEPTWSVNTKGQIVVESKDELVRRLGRSPDEGDAVMMVMWEPDPPATGWTIGR
jgi:hypothetical protein